jgi:hypothetical protein
LCRIDSPLKNAAKRFVQGLYVDKAVHGARCGRGTVVATYLPFIRHRSEMVLSPVSRDSPKESSVSTAKSNGRGARASRHPVLVCGGAGFLGSHLCARLLARGERVLCVDNFCTSEEESIAGLLAQPGFMLLRRDVATLQEEELGPLAAIYNLACAASPVHYQRSPLDTLFSSVRGMDNLLRIAHRCRARIFQASTSEIYGHPAMHPQTENYWGYVNPIGPRSC